MLEEIKGETDLEKWVFDVIYDVQSEYLEAKDATEIVIAASKIYLSASQKNKPCFLPDFGSLLIRAENQEERMSMFQESLLFCENCI